MPKTGAARLWTGQEIAIAQKMRIDGMTYEEIGHQLGRSKNGVHKMLEKTTYPGAPDRSASCHLADKKFAAAMKKAGIPDGAGFEDVRLRRPARRLNSAPAPTHVAREANC